MKKVMAVLGILVFIWLSGCGKGGGKSIVGRWKEVDGTQTIEFFKDGKIIIQDKEEPPLTGSYKLTGSKIEMNVPLFGLIVAKIVSGDEITLTNPFGVIEKYRRLEDSREVKKTKAVVHPKRMSGKYVNQSDKDEYLELRSDGTFTSSNPLYGLGGKFTGEWRVATIISFVFSSHRGEPTEYNSIEGEIVGNTFLVEGLNFGRWWHTLPRKNITPWVRKGNAPLIKTINQDKNIWSVYSNEDWLFEFQLKKDRTFSINGKGEWELSRNIVEICNPAREEKVFRGEINEDNTLVFFICLMGAVFEKQNSAQIIERTGEYVRSQEGALWSRYVRGEDENIILEFDKSGSFRMTGKGIWMTYTGIICYTADKQWEWRVIARDGMLIHPPDQRWIKQ